MSTIAPPPKPINPALLDSEQYIDTQIRRTRMALKVVDLAAGLLTLAIGLLAFTLIAAVLDHWVIPGGLSGAGRAVLFGLLMIGLAWYGWRQFMPLLRPINPVYAAHTIERTAPSLKNSLLNLLLFRTRRQQMSARVYHALEQQAAQRLSTATLDAAVDRSALLRLGYALLLIIAVCAIYSVLSPKNLAVSAVRVFNPWSDLAAPSRVQILDIKPGDASVAKGERVAVSAEVQGLQAEEAVRLRYSTADEQLVDESVTMSPPPPESRRFEAQLPRGVAEAEQAGVEQDLVYWIEAGDARSRKFKLSVFLRPTIIVQKVRYDFPAYTGFPSKEVGDTGDIRGLEGTQVTISALASKPIKSAYVDFDADGRNDLRMNVEGDRATATFQLALRDDRRRPRHASYILRFTTNEGRTNVDPPKYRIDVTPDYAPEVRITKPEEPERTARVDEIVQIGVEARDPDFAVQRVRLVGKVGDGDEVTLAEMLSENHEGRYGGIEMFTPGDAQLKPGEVLEYWAEARDNRRPEANVAFSEHRRLKIVGPPDQPPPKGQQPQQQPGGQQQPQPGDPQDGQQGQGGPQQQGGQAGDQGAKGEGQQGPGGAAGAQGQQKENAQSQEGDGGQGQSRQSTNDTKQQPGEGDAAASSDNSQQSQQPSPNDAAQGGAGEPASAGGQPQDSAQQKPANSNAGAAAGGAQQAEPQASQEAQPSKVSADGDNDGEAFQRISEHLNQQNAGEQQPAGDPASGEPASAGGPNAQQEGADPAEPKANQPAQAGQPGANQSPPDKSTDAAGQSKNQSQQKQPAEGAQPNGPRENATAAEQQTSPAGQSPSQRQGADVPRETETGDGNPNDPKAAQRPSPDSAMNRNDGDAGAGGATGKEQGSPGDENSAKRARDKTDDDNRTRRDDQEPPGGSPDMRESDSQGGQSGEQTGGGQEGGGQHADAPGQGEAGQHQAADEGAGRADEQGRGETGSKTGSDQLAEGKTGESSDNQPGQGSKQGEAGESASAGGPDGKQPAGEKLSDDDAPEPGKPGGEQSGEPNADGQRSPDESPAGQPGGEQPGVEGTSASPPQAGARESSEPPSGNPPPSDQPSKQGAAGAAQPQGGGSGSASDAASPPSAEEEAADAANLKYAREQTDLILQRLDEQMAKKKVDEGLLKRLGWSEADLRKFVDRWKDLKDRAAGQGDDADAASQELDAALRSLGLRRQGALGFRAASKADQIRDLNEAYRTRAPIEYADRVRAYVKSAAEGSD